MVSEIYIALGANLIHSEYGAPPQILERAIRLLSDEFKIKARSSIYRTHPMPLSDQPDYANAVVAVTSELPAEELLKRLQLLEKKFGRVRKERNEARILDLDIIDYKGQVREDGGLTLPHPRIGERPFVLYPLAEIAPDWVHPLSGKKIEKLLAELPEGHQIAFWE